MRTRVSHTGISNRLTTVLKKERIGMVMCSVFFLYALQSLADAVGAPFLSKLTHYFNTHTDAFPHYQRPISGLEFALKAGDAIVFAILAWVFYRWLVREEGGKSWSNE